MSKVAVLVVFALFLCAASALDLKAVGSPILEQATEEMVKYWTPERMQSAIPLEIEGREFNVSEAMEKIDPNARPGKTAGYSPDQADTMNTTSTEVCALSTGYAPSYSTYPWVTIGKVFFTQGGVSYVCSGAAIHNYGIITAGHCVYSTGLGVYSGNFIFVPGYNNGAAPYGIFSAYNFWVWSTYIATGDWCYDYAFVPLCRWNGYYVGQWVGWLCLQWNAGYGQTWTSLGYPQAPPFTGLWNYYATSSLCVQDSSCTFGIASDATGGASGGPFVIGWGTTNCVNGVNSYKYTDPTLYWLLFSPYFDTNVYNLWLAAFASAPPC